MNDLDPILELVAKYNDQKPSVDTLILAVLLNQLIREVDRVSDQLQNIDGSIEQLTRNPYRE